MTKRIEVIAGAGGEDSQDFARMLREMYAAWNGPVTGEAGIHRLVRISPFDKQRRRHTAFAEVIVHGERVRDQVRSYTLDPSERVKDHRTGQETDRAIEVLAGDLSLIRDAAKPTAWKPPDYRDPSPRIITDAELQAADQWAKSREGRRALRDQPLLRYRLRAWWTRRWWSKQSRRTRDQRRRLVEARSRLASLPTQTA